MITIGDDIDFDTCTASCGRHTYGIISGNMAALPVGHLVEAIRWLKRQVFRSRRSYAISLEETTIRCDGHVHFGVLIDGAIQSYVRMGKEVFTIDKGGAALILHWHTRRRNWKMLNASMLPNGRDYYLTWESVHELEEVYYSRVKFDISHVLDELELQDMEVRFGPDLESHYSYDHDHDDDDDDSDDDDDEDDDVPDVLETIAP